MDPARAEASAAPGRRRWLVLAAGLAGTANDIYLPVTAAERRLTLAGPPAHERPRLM